MADTERSRRAGKRTLIEISSSSSSSSNEGSSLELESESEHYDISSESEDYDDISSDDSVEEITSSTSCDEDDDDDCVGEDNNGKDEESMCSRVVNLLQGKSDIQELTLVECKDYLWKHGLRLSGTRAECILRIKEHWRLKDGIGETIYPRSSFTINCTGDVCRGDVVLFTQKVYKSRFDKVTRSGSLLGKRTVAGRIIKESYGAAKQQHTFTVRQNNDVEVLWSKGVKKLPPLFPLLVKGRNLYRLKTYRQCWRNEKERSTVLAEKHRRGAAARLIREMRRTKAAQKMQKISSTKEGNKRQKHFHQHSRSPQITKAVKEAEHADKHGKIPVGNQKCNYYRKKVPAFGRSNLKRTRKLSPRSAHQQHQNFLHPCKDQEFSYDCPPHYGCPSDERRNSSSRPGLRTNGTSQPFSYKADSSRRRR